MYITTIWYRIATSGDTPARINPVIAPGRLINPTTLVESNVGISAVRNNSRRCGAKAAVALSPNESRASIAARCPRTSATMRDNVTPVAAIDPLTTMPPTGTTTRGVL
ncbi:hypothetical protein Caci_2372 [Catenulispora acidiphila DSM 44928]|uniref:Uncharacterized protein n=1 Tax=Catenulispora acidiphila (strain DSM 44928 / JCM 14897 / NBRC 102108 / NRRL B-24433 / ID139908) TaxID=479433 RepID=C7PVP8_CATAD|nr:hypothetical protein Caci_2372 [Catenulispora acidiphila DSM 44928]